MVKKIKSEAFVAFAAIVISLCALIVSFYEVRIMRTQQKASLYPHLQISQQYSPEGFAIEAKNKGIGPAKVESLEVKVNGKKMPSLTAVFDYVLGEGHQINYRNYTVNTINNLVLEPAYDKPLVKLNWNDDSRRFIESLKDLEINVVYSSLLGDCWLVGFDRIPESCNCPKEGESTSTFKF